MHGLGNDYIYIDCMDGTFGGDDRSIVTDSSRLEEISSRLSNRHFGIGGDGIVLILPSDNADFRMRIFNADGSEARMCGNASRCIGKYVYDNQLTEKTDITLETASGVKYLQLQIGADGKVESVTVDMGEPEFNPRNIPVVTSVNQGNVDIKVALSNGQEIKLTAVSMGNPHGVVFIDDFNDIDVHSIGRELEVHPIWPDRANIEFAKVVSQKEIIMRVWERGSGETMACGTGACASACAMMAAGKLDREAAVHLAGGDLSVRWDEKSGQMFMTGPAVTVFDGETADRQGYFPCGTMI